MIRECKIEFSNCDLLIYQNKVKERKLFRCKTKHCSAFAKELIPRLVFRSNRPPLIVNSKQSISFCDTSFKIFIDGNMYHVKLASE